MQKNNDLIKKDHWAILTILLITLLGLWQLAFLKYPMKWDIIDQALPWKYFIGETLKNHILPLWNPYQHCGYPIHADPQSSAWYPITWFWGYFFEYNIYILSLDVVLHIFLAGVGMYSLGRSLEFRRDVSLIMGISYMFSGFFVSNAQHFMWIIAGTWLPFVMAQYLLLAKNPSFKRAVIFSLFMFLILSGGYPAFIMMLFYFISILFLWYFYDKYKKEGLNKALYFLKFNVLAVGLSVLTSMVVIVSVVKLIPFMDRSQGVTLTQALFGPFSTKTLISFLLPFGVVSRDFSWSGTDISMANGYFGIFMISLLATSVFLKKPPVIKIFFYWALFMLAAAVGDALPIREFLYHYIPFFNLFRFPAMLRIFTIIGFIVTAGYALNHFLSKANLFLIRKYLILTAVSIILYVIYKIYQTGLYFEDYFKALDLFRISKWNYITEHILFQAIIQLIILTILFIIVKKITKVRQLSFILILIVAFDMTFSLQLNAPYTILSHYSTQKNIYKTTKSKYSNGFPIPENTPLIENSDKKLQKELKWFWKNLSIFYKKISWDGYNPMHLKDFMLLEDSLQNILMETMKNPPVFCSKNISPFYAIKNDEKNKHLSQSKIYLKKEDYSSIKLPLQADTLLTNKHEIIMFNPNKTVIKTNCSEQSVLVYLQNYYYGWSVKIDGKINKLLKADGTFISVFVPAGKHTVEFIYKPKAIIYAFYISLITVILSIVYLLYNFFHNRNSKNVL